MIDLYKQIILNALTRRAKSRLAGAPDLKRHLIVNADQTEFVLLTVGWFQKRYRHAVVFHVEIKDNKIWIHQDNTDADIAEVFADKGIPKSDIVLGFLPWYAREVEGRDEL
ncbi:MAG: element excision factor XisI family protein [Bacteroidota bacterium]